MWLERESRVKYQMNDRRSEGSDAVTMLELSEVSLKGTKIAQEYVRV